MADFADLMKAETAKKTEQKETPPRIIEQNHPAHLPESQPTGRKQTIDTTPPQHRISQASENASIHASEHASTIALDTDLELIRKTLKLIGKEVLYVRLTPEEVSNNLFFCQAVVIL